MTEHWWQRLFRDGDDAQFDESSFVPGAADCDADDRRPGRFLDKSRHVSVKMSSQYPSHSPKRRAVPAQPDDEKRHQAKEAADGSKGSPLLASRNKRPFHPTKVPSPVFGFRTPPDDFYRRRSEVSRLEPQKENVEKKHIQEAIKKQGAEIASHIADHFPTLEPPALERRLPERQAGPGIDEAPGITPAAAEQAATAESQKKNQTAARMSRETEAPRALRPSGSLLPHSPHRSVSSPSHVPFNVLMFRSDRDRGTKSAGSSASPRQCGLRLSLDLLDTPPQRTAGEERWIVGKQNTLQETLADFHVDADITGHVQGSSVTRYDVRLHPGVKINKLVGLAEDIKLTLAAKQIRIAPVPGTNQVGIEIPNETPRPVVLRDIVADDSFVHEEAPLTAALGEDIAGSQVMIDLAKMPHGLIAGATGSGKSVCIHSLIISLIYKTSPRDLRFLLVDPKIVELAAYRQLPHLAAPVLTEPREAALALKWAVEEMERRYRRFAGCGVRDIGGYNRRQASIGAEENHLPYLVIIIDELADLMMASPQDVEESVCRIAQKARAAGIHLLLATQRPSVDVITGLIKSNIPTRIAFAVASQTDSRTILDSGGAEKLLGRGDMLLAENGARDLRRLQGCFISEREISRVTAACRSTETDYLFVPDEYQPAGSDQGDDELLEDAATYVVEQGQASASALQRRFRIGYNRAARLVDELESRQVISGANGSKPRQVLVTKERLEQLTQQRLSSE